LAVLLVGIDWAERHHDVCMMAADGRVLATERIADGVAGVARLHQLIARHADTPAEVVGIETDRGLLVGALVAAGYQVIAVNPLAASRYRERHTISGAKSDRADARMLADLVRTDRHHHRPAKGDSGLAEAVKVLARGHQQLVWARQRQANILRSTLRAFYPAALAAFGGDPGGRDAVAVLSLAPCPELGRALSHAELVDALRGRVAGGRSTPVLPPSRPRWPASSWRRRRWWPTPTARWWRPRWRSSPA
jgi:transposase